MSSSSVRLILQLDGVTLFLFLAEFDGDMIWLEEVVVAFNEVSGIFRLVSETLLLMGDKVDAEEAEDEDNFSRLVIITAFCGLKLF